MNMATITKESVYRIDVKVNASYIPAQSVPELQRYVFSYTITIRNLGNIGARLISRHWLITDANGKVQEVRGLGVVGEQPYLRPGESYQYTSGAILETPIGNMQGSYQMLAEDQTEFNAQIPAFTLYMPNQLH